MIGNKILLEKENTAFGETPAAGEGDNSHGGETTAAETGGSSGGAPAAKETTGAHEETTAARETSTSGGTSGSGGGASASGGTGGSGGGASTSSGTSGSGGGASASGGTSGSGGGASASGGTSGSGGGASTSGGTGGSSGETSASGGTGGSSGGASASGGTGGSSGGASASGGTGGSSGETSASGGTTEASGETSASGETTGAHGETSAAGETTGAPEETSADTEGNGSKETTGTDANLSGTGGQAGHEGVNEGESGDSSEGTDRESFFGEGETSEEDESLSSESGAEEASTESYIIDENGETQVIFDAEPETEYMVSTPADANSGAGSGSGNTSAFSQAYHSAAGAVAKTAQSAVKSAAPTLKNIGFNFLSAILIVIAGVYLSKLLKKLLDRAFEKIHMDASLRSFISSAAYVLGCGMAGFMALERIGVSTASIITVLGSAGLAVSLSLRDFLTNFAGGMIILVLKPFRTGDYIICGTAEGTVVSTSLFYTTLDTVDNRQMVLPNGALSNANIINVTAEPRRRLEIRVDISYESDIRQAKAILSKLFDMHPDIMHDEEIVVFVDNLGESGITLVARGWVVKEKYWTTKWQMTEDLKYAFDEAGVVIPYRQLVVHTPDEEADGRRDIKGDIKGGY